MEIKNLLTRVNYTPMHPKNNEYIVIHYTGNKGDTAKNNCNYFLDTNRGASANYFVDEDNIYCCVEPQNKSWHCGGGMQSSQGGSVYGKCTNSNSIGIEMCLWDKNGNERQGTIDNTIALTKWLMAKYHIPITKVVRHWDVVGKDCPSGWTGNSNVKWQNFLNKLKDGDDDMTKDEVIKIAKEANAEIINKIGADIGAIFTKIEKIEELLAKRNEQIWEQKVRIDDLERKLSTDDGK